jgi:hypothetical protein
MIAASPDGPVSACVSSLPHTGAGILEALSATRPLRLHRGWSSRAGAFMRQWKAIIGVEADEGMLLLAQ